MALNFGQLISSAGISAASQREAENAAIRQRADLMQVQEANRMREVRARLGEGTDEIANAPIRGFSQTPGVDVGDPSASPAAPAAPPPRQPGGFSPVPDAAVGVRTFDQLRGVSLDQLTGPEFQGLSQPDKTRYISELNLDRQASGDRAFITSGGGLFRAARSIAGTAYNEAARGLNTIGGTRIGRAIGFHGGIPTLPAVGLKEAQKNQPLTEAQVFKQLQTQDAAKEATRAKTAKESEAGGYEPWQLNTTGKPIRELVHNNPTNMRFNPNIGWEGEDGYTETPAGKFGNFTSPEAGIRAAAMNVATHFDRGDDTIAKLVARLSPSNENDTRTLITKAAKAMGVGPTTRLNMRDPGVMHRVVDALIKNEIGKNPYPDSVLDEGIRLGLNKLPLPAGGSSLATQLAAMSPAEQAQYTAKYDRDFPPSAGQPGVAFADILTAARLNDEANAKNAGAGQTLSGTGLAQNAPPPQAAGVRVPGAPAAPTTTAVATAPAQTLNQAINTGTAKDVATAVAATISVRPAKDGVMYGRGTIEPDAYNPQIQQVLNNRDILRKQVALYNQYGMGDKALDAASKIQAIDLGLYKTQADIGIYEGSTTGNFSRAMSVLSAFVGTPHQVLRRNDGKFDLYVNGKVVKAALDSTQVEQLVRTQVDTGYRTQLSQLQVERGNKAFETDQKIREVTATQILQTQREIGNELIKGNFKLAEEKLKLAGFIGTPLGDSTGKALYRDGLGNAFIIDPANRTITVDGKAGDSGVTAQRVNMGIWNTATAPTVREVR